MPRRAAFTTLALLAAGFFLSAAVAPCHAARNNDRQNQSAINAVNKKISDIKREMSQLDKAVNARMKELKEAAPKKIDPVLKALKEAEKNEESTKKEMLKRIDALRSAEADLATVAKSMQTGASSSPAYRNAELEAAKAEAELEKIESQLERSLRDDAAYQSAKKRVASAKLRVDIQQSRAQDGKASPRDLVRASNELIVAESKLNQLKENHFGKNEDYAGAQERLSKANAALATARAESASSLRDKPEYAAAEAKVDQAREAFVEANTAHRAATSEKYKHTAQINSMKAEVKKFAKETDSLSGRLNYLKNELAKQERNKRNLSRRR